MTLRRSFLLPAVLLVAALAAACQPSAEALPRLDDPKEILEEAIRTTAELEFVHARLEAATTGGEDLIGAQGYTLEGDLDVGQREFHAVLTGNSGNGGSQQAEVLLVGTDMFTRTQTGDPTDPANGRWQRMPIDAGSDPRNGIPATPAIAVALKALLADPGISTTLEGMESCGDRQCYQLTATIAPEATWRAMNGGLLGGEPGAELGPPDPQVPEIVLDILVDEATRQLVSVKTSVAVQGTSAELAATFSNHNVEFDLLAPPPEQVIEANEGGGFAPAPPQGPGVIIEEVGPTPAPMQ